jgi:hypothetical protein
MMQNAGAFADSKIRAAPVREWPAMRGHARTRSTMFHAFDVEDRIRPDHPLRAIREVVDSILVGLSPLLASAYSDIGRPCIPPRCS